jgi:hypothetical protein
VQSQVASFNKAFHRAPHRVGLRRAIAIFILQPERADWAAPDGVS